jgi:sarcosine/dimethylglycine N-methyltransferase
LGGPSRYLASNYGCHVTAVDLSPSFVTVAQLLARRTGLHALVCYQTGDLLALLFADSRFDVVWTQHVVMNIPDRERVYGEFRRVLKPGGKLAFYDVLATDAKPELHFPVPWSESGQVGAPIGLTPRLLRQNLVLRENRKIVPEPRPTIG